MRKLQAIRIERQRPKKWYFNRESHEEAVAKQLAERDK